MSKWEDDRHTPCRGLVRSCLRFDHLTTEHNLDFEQISLYNFRMEFAINWFSRRPWCTLMMHQSQLESNTNGDSMSVLSK